MIANVNEQLWVDFDLDTAVFLDTIAYWIKKNLSSQRHFHEGRYWSYNSYAGLTVMFPGWTVDVLRRIIKNCVKNDLLLIGNFNFKNYDNTNWYTLTDKGLMYYRNLHGLILSTPGETTIPPGETTRPIPTLPTTNSILNKNTISEFQNSPTTALKMKPKKQSPVELRELIDIYRNIFPDNPQPHKRVISTSLQKTLSALVKRWPELDPEGKAFSLDGFSRYLSLLKTSAPKFSLGEYITPDGNKKKNGLETFARWNTIVKFLENAYS